LFYNPGVVKQLEKTERNLGGRIMAVQRFVWAGFVGFVMVAVISCTAVAAESAAPKSYTVTVQTDKTAEPISKYIYGQFIEHLGRCIYGGIWAEILEDRKFYYPITDNFNPWGTATDRNWNAGPYKFLNASPWKVIGPAGTVTMDTTNPYVGAHTPVIHLPGNGTESGISQDGLALVKGKEYTGRIILAADKEAAPVEVRFVLEDGKTIRHVMDIMSPDYRTHTIEFTAPASSDNVRIEIVSKGKGTFKIGTLSLMPADNIKGWRKDVVALLKELDSPIYRWPGGNFVSGYNWRDGIGPRDKRPPRKNPAWKGVEHNDVGIHEYMELMELIGSEPFVSVNTGLGTVEEVAEEVQYFNGAADTPMGKLRAQNGHPKPYKVEWWAVGNEMFGSWQLGHMPLEEYVKKHNRVAEAMWNVDKSIKLIGVGDVGRWDETMLKVCSNYMNLISEHIYCKDKKDVVEHAKQLSQEIIRKADAHRKYRKEIPELAGKDIRIAMDEWNFWYGNYIYGELGVRYHQKDALGAAIGLHEYFRNSDIYFMANYAQTVNVIGAIKTTMTDSAFETTGLVLKLYRNHFGAIPVAVSGNAAPLDVSAAWTTDKKTMTVGVVNPTQSECKLTLDVKAAALGNKARVWVIADSDPMAYNEPGKPPRIVIKESQTDFNGTVQLPAYSINLWELPIK
jgi:alpha-N-arabinofuranosidase